MQKTKINIYCDGACLGNPGPGGYAALLLHQGAKKVTERIVSGHERHTTNNRMELRAAIEGLKALSRPCHVTLFSDSKYVIRGMTEWLPGWIQSGFLSSRKRPIQNADLWQELVQQAQRHEVLWKWVKGHAGHPENERVDQIANEQACLIKHQIQNHSR